MSFIMKFLIAMLILAAIDYAWIWVKLPKRRFPLFFTKEDLLLIHSNLWHTASVAAAMGVWWGEVGL